MFEQDNEQQSITTLLLDAILEVKYGLTLISYIKVDGHISLGSNSDIEIFACLFIGAFQKEFSPSWNKSFLKEYPLPLLLKSFMY